MPYFKDEQNRIHFLSEKDIENGGVFMLPQNCVPLSKEEAESFLPVAVEAEIVVSPRQIRQALNAFNKRSSVESGVASADQDIKDWWEFSTAFEENHPAIIDMCQVVGISQEDRHAIFQFAATL